MNAIGKIGAIIIKYQYQIEIALLSLLALIVLIGFNQVNHQRIEAKGCTIRD